ncbi:MAG: DsrH/TusB family sulfur metabolism protein [Candidatus Brocadiales bacterium]
MKTLHIIREKDHALAISTARDQAGPASAAGNELAVLLIHDAVLTGEDRLGGLSATVTVTIMVLKDDAAARAVESPYPSIDYDGMLKLVFDSDKVICW